MKELADIINERDSNFKKSTFEIFTAMDITLECIETFLGSLEPMFTVGIFTWDDVYIADELITILGGLYFEDGMVIEAPEGDVNITNANADYHQRVIRMSLPYELVASGDGEAIMLFLKKLHEASDIESNQSIENLHEPITNQEFDLSELTSEQQASLKLYNNKGRDS